MLLKVGPEEEDNVLVEMYSNEEGEFTNPGGWGQAAPCTVKALEQALRDVTRDGVNTWHYENGTWTWVETPVGEAKWVEYTEEERWILDKIRMEEEWGQIPPGGAQGPPGKRRRE